MLDGKVCEMLCILEIVLKEVEKGDVILSHSHHNLVFLLEPFEAFDSFLYLLILYEVDGLGNLHFRLDLRQVGSL